MRSLYLFSIILILLPYVLCSTIDDSNNNNHPSLSSSDPDDSALMELGIHLTQGSEAKVDTGVGVPPLPTYTSTKPANHYDGTIAKFPLLHEIKGLEKKDWNDIQGLLFREPAVAAESNLDAKLDELEKNSIKFQ